MCSLKCIVFGVYLAVFILNPKYYTLLPQRLRQIRGMSHPDYLQQYLNRELAAYWSCSYLFCRKKVGK